MQAPLAREEVPRQPLYGYIHMDAPPLTPTPPPPSPPLTLLLPSLFSSPHSSPPLTLLLPPLCSCPLDMDALPLALLCPSLCSSPPPAVALFNLRQLRE